MSFIYSQALVEEYSRANCSDIGASALSSESHTHKPFLWHDKTMEHSRHSRFGMTFAPLMESHGKDLLTWWREDFLAKTSALQETEQGYQEKDRDYGQKWRGLLAKYSRDTHSLKTVQLSLLEDLTGCCVTLPRWGSMRNGELYQQQIPAHLIGAKESGYWPTPQTRFGTNDGDLAQFAKKCETFEEFNSMAYRAGSAKKKKYWPTPTVCGNHNRKGASLTSGDGLATVVMRFPTPTARLAKETNAPSEATRNEPSLTSICGGLLNPDWVEWLMGWPIGHTDLKPLEMGRCQEWRQQHSPFFQGKEAA